MVVRSSGDIVVQKSGKTLKTMGTGKQDVNIKSLFKGHTSIKVMVLGTSDLLEITKGNDIMVDSVYRILI